MHNNIHGHISSIMLCTMYSNIIMIPYFYRIAVHIILIIIHIQYITCYYTIGIMRGWLPTSYLADCLNKDIVAHIPTVPGFLVYFAESRYAYYE